MVEQLQGEACDVAWEKLALLYDALDRLLAPLETGRKEVFELALHVAQIVEDFLPTRLQGALQRLQVAEAVDLDHFSTLHLLYLVVQLDHVTQHPVD